ncbi:artemis protein [Ustulina deusta]|nr:artemis protein [Ustulina deusta]
MSTFKGIVSEFPGIRVDFFRRLPGFPPPLACFLSHVHSDHLAGLETFDGSFIYCSAATKEILLRLEKKSVRLNYARGILEDPRQQTYKHLEKKLKPLPLDTPTSIDLLPGCTIRVTLLDANHCVGAVMFLFEGFGTAVLYTGDIRCEPRFVTAITQNPNMIEYSSGWKTLDRIYLDTSVLDNYPLQTKAEGIRELFEKLQKYPQDTIFHFQAWTYGYEEVWIALSKALNSKIHVDEYKMRVFESLVTKPKDNRWAAQTHLAKEAPALVGFTCGNSPHEGCLTRDENVRIHSCEKGMGCSVMDNKPVVWIRPIVTHLRDGRDVMEVGIGGGGEDLTEATTLSPEDIFDILQLMSVSDRLPAELYPSMHMVKKAWSSGRDISLITDFDDTAEDAVTRLVNSLFHKLEAIRNPIKQRDETDISKPLSNVIHFPYARHSSLPELRDFTRAFKPRDITPCTFDADLWIQKGWSISGLFSDCCSGDTFEYDTILDHRAKELATSRRDAEQGHGSQQTANSPSRESSPVLHPAESSHVSNTTKSVSNSSTRSRGERQQEPGSVSLDPATGELHERDYDSFLDSIDLDDELDLQGDSQTSNISDRTYATRRMAFDTAIANINGDSWGTIGLISTTDNHTSLDEELGHHFSPQENNSTSSPDLAPV